MKKAESISRGRRRVLRTVGTTIAAAVAAPSQPLADQHARHASAGAKAPATPVQSPPPTAPPMPSVLDAHERDTLSAIGDELVPGSKAAGTSALIDRVLATESADVLRQFRNALGAFEREARQRYGRTWLSLPSERRLALLQEAAAAPLSVPPRAGWRPGEPVLAKNPAGPPPPPTLRDHLETLRDIVARAYVTTEAGATEFGWTGAAVFDGLPACTHGSTTTR